MLRIAFISLMLILSSLACNLASSTEPENTAIPLNQNISTQTPIVVTATATSQNNTPVNNVSTKAPHGYRRLFCKNRLASILGIGGRYPQ